MSARLEGKIAIVTGAGSGIGEAMVDLFVAEGAKVLAADISGEQERVAQRHGGACLPLSVDVADGASIEAMIGRAIERFGRIDILCNNAGIQGALARTADLADADFDTTIAVNLRGVFLGMKHVIPHMLRQGGGAIVNTSSTSSITAKAKLPGYSASKSGINGLTRVTAVEYAARNIRVNAIAPGPIDSSLTRALPPAYLEHAVKGIPMGRIGKPEEIARVALFLASEDASFITGQLIVADGGATII